MRRRNIWTEVWTSTPLGLVVNLSFGYTSGLLFNQAGEEFERLSLNKQNPSDAAKWSQPVS